MIAEIGENPHVHKELLRNTVEIVTGICDNAGAGDGRPARHARHRPRRSCATAGMELFCAGTHPFAKWSARKLTDAPRYAELIKRTQWWGRQMLIWGVHVHVGISSAQQGDADHHVAAQPVPAPAGAVGVLAVLGRRGHRLREQPRDDVPAAADRGAAVPLPDAGRSSKRFVHDQKKTGIIDHMNEIRWDIRPSPHLGTIEVRIFDGVSNLAELGALVALTHCLIVDLDRRLDAGEQLPDDAAVARAGEQVARSALRPGRGDHPGRRQQRAAGHRGPRRAAEPAGARRASRWAAPTNWPRCRSSTRRTRRINVSAGWPRSTTATCGRSSTRWSPSWNLVP